jgi:chemotaxis protein CheD
MAELAIGGPDDVLQALGLGSCIGLAMIDRQTHVGGLVHVMLPNSEVGKGKDSAPAKFADTGVPLLYDEMLKAGAVKSRLIVKMAGGAEMFSFAGKDSPKLSVGRRNAEAVEEELGKLGLRINAKDIGGTHGRTLEVDLSTLKCTIRVVGKGISEL